MFEYLLLKLRSSKLRNDVKGVTIVEYAIMLALVAIAVATAAPGISAAVVAVFNQAITLMGNTY